MNNNTEEQLGLRKCGEVQSTEALATWPVMIGTLAWYIIIMGALHYNKIVTKFICRAHYASFLFTQIF